MAERFPQIAAEWHPTRNGSLQPDAILPGSSRRIWWQCKVDSTHQWDATVTTRTHKKSSGRCPFCSGYFVTDANSLTTHHPILAAQWHPSKNLPLMPNAVSRGSARRVWWQCDLKPDHIWEAKIKNRSLLGSGCPHCELESRGARLRESLLDSANANADPHKTFADNLQGLRSLIKTAPTPPKLKQMFFRMLYSSAITIMETYLSDTFYQLVTRDELLMEKLIRSAPEFRDRKYSLTDLLEWNRDIQKKVTEYLFELVWHNLSKVQHLYAALEINIPENEQVYRAVSLRHDIVHRNGRSKSGTLHRFTEGDIQTVFNTIETYVSSIDARVKTRGARQV